MTMTMTMKKICVIFFVASLLMVVFTNEVNAEVTSKNRKLMNNSVDRNSPSGPSPCFHCMDGKGRQIIPSSDEDGSRN